MLIAYRIRAEFKAVAEEMRKLGVFCKVSRAAGLPAGWLPPCGGVAAAPSAPKPLGLICHTALALVLLPAAGDAGGGGGQRPGTRHEPGWRQLWTTPSLPEAMRSYSCRGSAAAAAQQAQPAFAPRGAAITSLRHLSGRAGA